MAVTLVRTLERLDGRRFGAEGAGVLAMVRAGLGSHGGVVGVGTVHG